MFGEAHQGRQSPFKPYTLVPEREKGKIMKIAYTINDDGKTCTVTRNGLLGLCLFKGPVLDLQLDGSVLNIPSEIDGYKVTGIGDLAFFNCGHITGVTIPEGVTIIGHRAFAGCNSLKSITIPTSVRWIGMWAFYGCENLLSVVIPESVISIGYDAFRGCTGLKNITVPKGVAGSDFAFYGCVDLTII